MSETVTEAQPGATPEGPQYVDLNAINDPEQLRAVMSNPEKFTSEKPAEVVETPGETPGEKPIETPPGEKPKGAEKPVEVVEEPTHKNRVKVRIAHLPESQQEVLKLVSLGKTVPEAQADVVATLIRDGKSLAEAEAEVFGTAGRKVVEEPKGAEKPVEKPVETVVDPVKTKQDELDALRAELDKAEEAYDLKASRVLRDKIDDARWELRELKAAAKNAVQVAETTAAQKIVNEIALHTARAIELFPDAENEGTPLFEAIQDAVEDLRESDPDFFLNPRWPITLAAEKAAELGIPSTKHKGGATPQPGEQPPGPPAKRQARSITPASGASGGSASKPNEGSDPAAELEAAGTDPVLLQAYLKKYGRRDVSRIPLADAFAA